jgi:hypothetical protein
MGAMSRLNVTCFGLSPANATTENSNAQPDSNLFPNRDRKGVVVEFSGAATTPLRSRLGKTCVMVDK